MQAVKLDTIEAVQGMTVTKFEVRTVSFKGRYSRRVFKTREAAERCVQLFADIGRCARVVEIKVA